MDEKFQKELKDLLAKHGLKGVDTDTSDNAGDKAEKNQEAEVIASLGDKIAQKLADAIATNKGYSDEDKKELKKELVTKIHTNYAGMKEITYPTDLASLTKEEKIVTFFNALMFAHFDSASNQVVRALVEGTDAYGGYLVPEELRSEIFRILPDMSVMRQLARVIPMSTDTLQLNTLQTRPEAYWQSEYNTLTTTSAEFGQVTLTPNNLTCLLPISEQLLQDANINTVQFIIELFAETIALAEDKAFFTGSGTGEPKGILTETLTTIDAGGNGTFDHIIDLMDSISMRLTTNPRTAFVGNRRTKSLLRKLKDNNGNPIWRDGGTLTNGETKRLPDTLYGYPFYVQNNIGNNIILFGDWSNYIIGDRQTLSIRTTDVGGDAWRRNSVEIKAVERVDGKTVLPKAFAKLINL